MGEPLVGSIVCGSVALAMLIWNWRMVEHQKWLAKKCGREAARTARAREQARADAFAKATARNRADLAAMECVSTAAPSKSATACSAAPYVVKLESLPEWDEGCSTASSSESSESSEMFLKKRESRERLETAPMSPALSSTRSRSETGCFFSADM